MAGATRTAKKVIANVTEDEFNSSMSDFAVADAKEAQIKAKLDAQITKLREAVTSELEELAAEKDKAFEIIQHYCTSNRDSLFVTKKSMETLFGDVGFRTGTPKIKVLKGFNWTSVLHIVKEKLSDYVRTTEEIDKEQLLIDGKGDAELQQKMKSAGMYIDQDESFFIKLKKEGE
jgi:phage host-nuclease inhibitor protein Gam